MAEQSQHLKCINFKGEAVLHLRCTTLMKVSGVLPAAALTWPCKKMAIVFKYKKYHPEKI